MPIAIFQKNDLINQVSTAIDLLSGVASAAREGSITLGDILGEAIYGVDADGKAAGRTPGELRRLSRLFGTLHDLTLEQAVELTVTEQCRVVDEGKDFEVVEA